MGVGFWKRGGPILLVLPNLTALILLSATFLILNWPPVNVKTTAVRIDRGGFQYERLEKSKHCSRICVDGVKPKECHFKFKLEPVVTASRDCSRCSGNETDCKNHHCIMADGYERTMLAINGQLPGTPIQVCEGDVVVVDVQNELYGLEMSLHWHGQHQYGTPYMDGVPMITQCPIESSNSFRYKFRASNPGTHFYHSHYVSHHADGIFGPFVVRQTRSRDPHSKMYDQDLDDHVITIAPWSHSLLAYNLDFQENSNIYSLLINGKGNFHNAGKQTIEVPKTEFAVKWGKRYRFRIINAASLDCPVHFQVEEHNLTIIAADGAAVKPAPTSHLILYPGERYDVVLHAKEKEASYWIQVKAHNKCKDIHQEALLVYSGATDRESKVQSSPDVFSASVQHKCSDISNKMCNIPALKSVGKKIYPELEKSKAEKTLFIPYDVFTYDHMEDKTIDFSFSFDEIPYYPSYLYNTNEVLRLPQVQGMTFLYPEFPLLTRREKIPDSTLCGVKCPYRGEFCECLNVIDVPFNTSLDIILIDQGKGSNQSHTFHLHGYSFHVLGSRSLGRPIELTEIEEMDKQGELLRNLQDPPMRDTVVIPNKGYAILRLFTNNPGYWLFEARSTSPIISEGMQFVLHVGEQSNLPSVPPSFPDCGSVTGPNYNEFT